MGGLYFPKQQLRRNCEQKLEQGMPSFNNFPFSRNNLCSCSSQFETDAKAWTEKVLGGIDVFSPNLSSPLWALFCPRKGRVGTFFLHTQVGGRNPWLIVNLFLPHPQSTYNAENVCGHKDYRMAYFLGDQLEKVTTKWWKNHCHHYRLLGSVLLKNR